MPETTILDQFGRPARLETEPLPDPAKWGRGFRSPRRFLPDIKPPNVASILRQAERGDPRAQAQLFDQMLDGDGRLPGNFGTRTKSVAKLAWELRPATDSPADKKVCEWLRPQLDALRLHNPLQRLARAVGYGYGAEQIEWELRGGEVGVRRLTHWPTRYLMPDDEGQIRRYTTAREVQPLDMPPARFIVHEPGELNPDSCVAGLLRPASWFWFFKKFTLKAWLMFNERYGQPFRVGKYPAGMSEEEQDSAFMSLVRMGAEAVAMMPDGMEVEFHQVATAMQGEAHQMLAGRCDDEITILVLGQTLTTSMGKNGGSYGAAKVHNEVREDLIEWDARQLEETIERDLITPWVRFQFGNNVEIPQFKLPIEDEEDQEQRSRVITAAVDMGLPVARSDAYEQLGIPEPEEGAELLSPPTAAPMPAPSAAFTRGVDPPGKPLWPGTRIRPDDLLIS